MRPLLPALLLIPALLAAAGPSAATWVPVARPDSSPVHALAVSGSHLLAGTDSGVYRSPDRGRTWSLVHRGRNRVLGVHEGRVYAGGMWYMARSADHGASWTEFADPPVSTEVRGFGFSGQRVYAGVTSYGVYRSLDRGDTWVDITQGLENNTILSLAARGTRLFAGSPWGVHVSADEGRAWSVSKSSPRSVMALVFHGKALFAGTLGRGVHRSDDDGATWREADAELDDQSAAVLCSADGRLYAGTSLGVWRYEEPGDIWKPHGEGLSDRSVTALAALGKILLAGGADGTLHCLGAGCPAGPPQGKP